ncbi:hypothetical protein PPERSA_01947 [Pseudocohnilembus persalinus]|uniref:Poly A polymerase head domain-containing protein n=1 Tax=Pseudocohnilembus persalinus TaxID=266149 RepID=A0A0V0R3J3_PSEPJ|nr:hypothetical protein PPERSA_01947 [Pseudocohnilembus persalinus]|eukprot:KRX09060.1 hypothetical protein PPERSA_01947 [Pseudocohnilembus persalinus]
MQIPSLPLYPKFRHLENWFQFVHKQISYDLKKLFIQELGQNEDQYNKLFNFEQIFKQNQQTKKTIEENEHLQPHIRETVSIKYDKIIPDEKEQILIDFLKEFIKNENLKVVLRCAGGWVRDKLLGVKSHDIDIALDSMMGEQFVTKLQEYSKKIGEPISSVGVIKANPDQSKHLETATCKVKGFDIDFVNLRGEYYAENSRIPTITFGSPTQDAERRDLTINSLFYNINEDKLEDFCGRGVQDLKNGICMTPLEPLKTFLDDPLRVLRTFRFASRYNYSIDKSLLEAIQQTKVKEALKEKVSRERMRTETEKMIRSRNPFLGLQMIHENNLWDVVFEVPKELEKQIQDDKIIDISYNFAKKTNEQYLFLILIFLYIYNLPIPLI